MTPIMEIYCAQRRLLEEELEAMHDSKEAVDALCAALERMRLAYRTGSKDAADREQADRLFDVARQSVKCMLSVSGISMNVVKDMPHTPTRLDKLIACLPTSGIVIGALLTCWLLIEDMNAPAFLAALLTAVGWLEAQVIYRRRIAVSAVAKVDSNEMLRFLDRMMEAIEDALDRSAQQRKKLEAAAPSLTEGSPVIAGAELLEPVQMLLEAGLGQDGAYALKALPGLQDALLRQGIETVMYSEETKAYFEMYPSIEAGVTIRPALVKEGKLVLRGQATEEMQ